MAKKIIDQFSLYLTEGKSDKEYHADLVEDDGGYRVQFRYGRRGGTLQHGEKTTAPVGLDKARSVFDGLLKEKSKKGYTPDVSGEVYSGHENAGLDSGERLNLLSKIDSSTLYDAVMNPNFFMQQKIDGERRAVKSVGVDVFGINKQNLKTPLPVSVVDAINAMMNKAGIPGDYLIDAEIVGDKLYVFDLIKADGKVFGSPANARFGLLRSIMEHNDSPALELVRTAFTPEEKKALIDEVVANNLEGIAIKHTVSGEGFKFKFYEECSVQVTSLNDGKRSVGISILSSGQITDIGNVTIPANQAIPEVGSIIEVKYLYAYEGGSLYQPVFHKPRPDIYAPDDADNLKYKPKSQSVMRP